MHGATARASARYGVPAEAGSSTVGQNAGAIRLYLPAGHDRKVARGLAGLAFVERSGNEILLGPPGVGKTIWP